MGFNKIITKYFFSKKAQLRYSGNVVTLGKQDIGVDYEDIKGITGISFGQGKLTDEKYLGLLGFDKVDSLEFSLMDGATIAHDLNQPLPSSLNNKFDWIIDGGTLEHCFNVREFMSSMVNMLKPGGHIFHINPSQGSSNHGMFNFQPTFYFSFYGANGLIDMECDLLEMHVNPKDIFINKDIKGRVIPIKNYNNLAFYSEYPTYNMFHAVKPLDYSRNDVAMPIQEFYYRIFTEKDKVNGGLIEDKLYKSIRGDVEENTIENILMNSYWL
jgi:SAM-dependent methyltransferase